ncbi:hypothetical protein Bca101_077483 [Brassica carinata]
MININNKNTTHNWAPEQGFRLTDEETTILSNRLGLSLRSAANDADLTERQADHCLFTSFLKRRRHTNLRTTRHFCLHTIDQDSEDRKQRLPLEGTAIPNSTVSLV